MRRWSGLGQTSRSGPVSASAVPGFGPALKSLWPVLPKSVLQGRPCSAPGWAVSAAEAVAPPAGQAGAAAEAAVEHGPGPGAARESGEASESQKRGQP